MNKSLALLGGVFVLAACPPPPSSLPRSAPGAQSLAIDGEYIHSKSRFVFPENFGKFERVVINQYDSAGSDVGVGYNLDDGALVVALTLYVRPPARTPSGEVLTLPEQFELEQAVVSQLHEGAASSAARTPPRTQNEEPLPGHSIAFRYVEEFAGRRQAVESLLYLFEYDGWVVKYRITYPASQAEQANLIAQVFVSAFRWRRGA